MYLPFEDECAWIFDENYSGCAMPCIQLRLMDASEWEMNMKSHTFFAQYFIGCVYQYIIMKINKWKTRLDYILPFHYRQGQLPQFRIRRNRSFRSVTFWSGQAVRKKQYFNEDELHFVSDHLFSECFDFGLNLIDTYADSFINKIFSFENVFYRHISLTIWPEKCDHLF